MKSLHESVEAEKAEGIEGEGLITKVKGAWRNKVVRRGLTAGITCQVSQQFVGINTVMYYSPTIVQFAGFASNETAIALSLVTSGLNAVGSIIAMFFVDRYGRRRLMLISCIGIIICLVTLSSVFFLAASRAPPVSKIDTIHFGGNNTCAAYLKPTTAPSWDCMDCLKEECGFCAAKNEVTKSIKSFQSINSLLYFVVSTIYKLISHCFFLLAFKTETTRSVLSF